MEAFDTTLSGTTHGPCVVVQACFYSELMMDDGWWE